MTAMTDPNPLTRIFRAAAPLLWGILFLAALAPAQNTLPFWSSLMGGGDRDEVTVIRRGPGPLITIAGYTRSTDLPVSLGSLNPAPVQGTLGGAYDAFVARFDPSLPAARQLLWCTYLGGSRDDFVFDMVVDEFTAVTTLVGLSRSRDFPGKQGQPSPLLRGLSDGFLVQLDSVGGSIRSSMFLGGAAADYLCAIETDGSKVFAVAGVTESRDLPWTLGTVSPTHHGGTTDTFVARVNPSNPIGQRGLWATYLGGNADDGRSYSSFVAQGGWPTNWEGQLDNVDLVLDPSGNLAVVTASALGTTPAATTPGAVQAVHAGARDAYLGVLDPSGANLIYATFFGGSKAEQPTGLCAHPTGGFVLCGFTSSVNMPTTSGCVQSTFQSCSNCIGPDTDGFVCHIDPTLSQTGLRYATYLGSDQGEDSLLAIEVESSGFVTVAGYCVGGGTFPATPRSMQSTATMRQFYGVIARLALKGRGSDDLLYSTFVGGSGAGWTWFNAMALDELGNAIAVGATNAWSYPKQGAFQTVLAGDYDGCVTYIPVLPGCVSRSQLALATPACGVPLYTGMSRAPVSGTTFAFTATNAPPAAQGVLLIGIASAPVHLPMPLNATLLVQTLVSASVVSDPLGAATLSVPIPTNLTPPCPWGLSAQWVFLTNTACGGRGGLAASERLDF